ncbi:DMT family transporter [Geopsychrobacter electrodiphilus]|uniref:DMT family transporter n=1 Tax=Geopsychrobacter electrodiphilus TaxID=225196 RepID=UPI0003626A55|nr:DMT family transporter [Geopsychrobacter electrodiphilus]
MRRTLINSIPIIFVVLWSTGFISAKYALPFIEPFYFLFIRMTLTIGVFLLLCLLFRVKRLSAKQAGHQMVTGFLVHGVYLGGVFAAIKWGMPAGITAIVVGVQPVLTACLGWRFLGERLRPRQWLGLGLGLAGVVVVLLSTSQQGGADLAWPALFAAIAALIAISLGTLYQKRFGTGTNLLAGSVWQYLSVALLMALLTWGFETQKVIWDIHLIFALGWLVLGLSVTAILLLMYMIREGATAKVASYFYLVPPVASIEAWFIFDEALSTVAIAAIATTVLGVYLVVKSAPARA